MNNEPLTAEGIVSLIGHNMYYYLHRFVQGQHYLGFAHTYRNRLSIYRLDPAKIRSWVTTPFKMNKNYLDGAGRTAHYVDAPYDDTQIEDFTNLTLDELEQRAGGNQI